MVAVMCGLGENGVSYLESVCVLPAGMGPAVLEKWQPQQTTLTAQSELLSMPRSEVWETNVCGCRSEPRALVLTDFQNPFLNRHLFA